MSRPIITLTSDFGSRDGYAGAMKGVILGICPDANIVDISHELPPHDVPHAAFVLSTACPYFPPDAVHVAVVDPGVGTERRPIVLTAPTGTFVAPDNGLLTHVLTTHGVHPTGKPNDTTDRLALSQVNLPDECAAYVLNLDRYWLKPTSKTFHGRDIFAPAAAHLASGVSPEELGEPIATLQCLDIPRPAERHGVIEGRVIHVDRFGNLVSNIRLDNQTPGSVLVKIAGRRIQGLSRSYAAAGEILAIVGSHGYLEVALRNGSAAKQLGAGVGAKMEVALSRDLTRP